MTRPIEDAPLAARIDAAPDLILGECPIVDERSGTLLFIDIAACALFRVPLSRLDDPEAYERVRLPDEPGCVVLDGDRPDAVLLGLPTGVFRYSWGAGELTQLAALPPAAAPVRINDGSCDAAGRFWFGTMNRAGGEPAGALFCFDGRDLVRVDGPVACWNGLGWSPGGDVMYATDTIGQELRCYDFDPDGLPNPGEGSWRVAIPGQAEAGLPDGLVVDADGGVWSALWDAGRVSRFRVTRAGARELFSVRVDGPRPTAATFLPDGALLVTSAAGGGVTGGLSVLPAAMTGVRGGLPENCFRARAASSGEDPGASPTAPEKLGWTNPPFC